MKISPDLLKQARLKAGLTQEQAAHKAGLTVSTVYRAERGKTMNVYSLCSLASVYGCTLDALSEE